MALNRRRSRGGLEGSSSGPPADHEAMEPENDEYEPMDDENHEQGLAEPEAQGRNKFGHKSRKPLQRKAWPNSRRPMSAGSGGGQRYPEAEGDPDTSLESGPVADGPGPKPGTQAWLDAQRGIARSSRKHLRRNRARPVRPVRSRGLKRGWMRSAGIARSSRSVLSRRDRRTVRCPRARSEARHSVAGRPARLPAGAGARPWFGARARAVPGRSGVRSGAETGHSSLAGRATRVPAGVGGALQVAKTFPARVLAPDAARAALGA